MAKKILIISNEYPPLGGGAGIVAQDTVEKLIKADINVTLITNTANRQNSNSNLNIIEVKTMPKVRFINFWSEIKKLSLSEYDKIILNDIGATMVASFYFNKEQMEKSIVYLHGSEPENIFVNPSITFRMLRFKNRYINLLENCYCIIAVSKFMKRKFIKYTGLIQLRNKIKVIYNGIDSDIFYKDPIDIRKILNIPEDAIILLTVSRIVKEKGYLVKYNIFKKLNEAKTIHWIILGEGEFQNRLKKIIEKDNLSSKVHFLGKIGREELRKYYSSVDYFWLLSDFEESLGLVYLEAQFCNTIVIGKNKAGVKEVILNKETGYLIEDEEEVFNIIVNKDEPEKKFEIIKNRFSFKENTRKLLKLLYE